jgi:arabinan endo-1,5-alpha-L-arabinosidase
MLCRFIFVLFLSCASIASAQTTAPTSRPTRNPDLPTLWLVGDSTVKVGTPQQQGWGDPLREFFDLSRINVENRARGGRSSRTFITEGLWDAVLREAKKGDYVLIQFGHNDGAAPEDGRGSLRGIGDESREVTDKKTGKVETVYTYGHYMRKYVRDAKAAGLTPVVVTYIPRCPRPGTNVPPATGPVGYAQDAADVAKQEGVECIDLFTRVLQKYQGLTPDQIKERYFGPQDFTHTSPAGARLNATCVLEGIRALKDGTLSKFISVTEKQTSQIGTDPTLAYWRFEDGVHRGQSPPEWCVLDYTGNGNLLRSLLPATSPGFSDDVPSKVVSLSGEPNRMSMDNTSAPEGNFPTRDFFADASITANLNRVTLDRWTIEASVKFAKREGWERSFQTFVGRDGYNVPGGSVLSENPLANLGFKKRGDNNRLSIEAFDSTGDYVVVQGGDEVLPDVWYDAAAISDGTTLRLYAKRSTESTMHLLGEAPFKGAMKNAGGMWSLGRGMYANQVREQMFGWIDEVRITRDALPLDRLLTGPRNAELLVEREVLPQRVPAPSTQPARAELPSSLIFAHDPVLYRDGDVYHVFASHEGFAHWTSTDLVNWTRVASAMPKPFEWGIRKYGARLGQWAPDVAKFNGLYHFYYSFSTWGSRQSSIGVMVSKSLDPSSPDYGWDDRGPVVESEHNSDFNAIDPAVLVDPNGQPWMAYGSYNSGIYLLKIDAATGKSVGERVHLAARPFNTQIEAAQLFHHDGWYYLLVSFDGCCAGTQSTYKLVVGRSKSVTGPYVDRSGKPMTEGGASLLLSTHDWCVGPGQSSMIVGKDGATYLAHHYYDTRANGRAALAVRGVAWDDQAWPLLVEPLAEPTQRYADVVGTWRVWVDYGSPTMLELRAGDSGWSVEGDRLRAQVDGDSFYAFVSPARDSFVGRSKSGAIVRGVRQKQS